MLLNCGTGKDSWESLGLQAQTSSILKEINSEYSLEGLTLKLKLQYFGHLIWRVDSLKRSWCWERLRQEEKGATEIDMVGWHHWLNGHEFEQTPGAGDGQGGLVCGNPWGCKETDMTEWLNWLTDPYYGAETSRLISEHHHSFKLTHKIKHHNHTPRMILNESIGRRESVGLCRNDCTWIEGGNGHFKDCGAVSLL